MRDFTGVSWASESSFPIGFGVVAAFAFSNPWRPIHSRTARSDVRVMTFNIRYGTADDGPNHWNHRQERVVETIRQFQPDLIGTQETMSFQAEYLRQCLPEYTYVGKLRVPDQPTSEECAVFFRSTRFVDLEQGHFWLSTTPEVPGSRELGFGTSPDGDMDQTL